MDSEPQRHELGAFIRAKREAMAPPYAAGRRRTPGLRREEAALQCGLSVTLFTWLEQGRNVSLTARSLALLANGLSLTAAERAYLFALGRHRDPEIPAPPPPLSPVPQTLITALNSISTPAYLLDECFTARFWNQPAATLFSPWLESGEPNLLKFVFQIPAARDFIMDWQASAQRLTAEFRAETAQAPENPRCQQILDELRQTSTDFQSFWDAHGVRTRTGGLRGFNHPQHGALHYTQVNFLHAGPERFRLIMLLP